MDYTKIPLIQLRDVNKSFAVGSQNVKVLYDINLTINSGDFIVILGPSGCGKSTLLNTMLGLEPPTSGEVVVREQNIYLYNEDQRATFRQNEFGVIYQQSNWIKSLNVVENIALPLDIEGLNHKQNIAQATKTLALFKMTKYKKYKPLELSGGQQQKIGACRALITNPSTIFADEPTGNLDSVSAAELMEDLIHLNEDLKRTIVMVTHNENYALYASKTVVMGNGRILNIIEKKKSFAQDDKPVSEEDKK